jgi:DNA-binding MurR/RpiR family transcriptional regulator
MTRLEVFKTLRKIKKIMRKCRIIFYHIGPSLELAEKVKNALIKTGYKVEIVKGNIVPKYALIIEK